MKLIALIQETNKKGQPSCKKNQENIIDKQGVIR